MNEPLIHEHYHIRELIEAQQKRVDERNKFKEIEKRQDEKLKGIKEFKEIEMLDFWCDKCQIDFIARAKKQIDNWSPIAYYKIKHTCGRWCIRHITDRFRDLYFFKSKKVARDRFNGFNDILQPFQTGYNILYKK